MSAPTATLAALASTEVPADGARVSGGSLAALRVVLGLVGAVSCARFLLNGWVGEMWVDPQHHFTWPGLWWVRPLPGGWMHAFVAGVGLAWLVAAARALRGGSSRTPLLVATVGFASLGAIDIAPYLNHYVLLVLLGLTLAVLGEGPTVPAWSPWAPRLVVATTYVWAAVAKFDGDWLSGRTMRPWLATHVDWPLVGELFRWGATAQTLAIAGLVFDLLVVPLLLWRRSRPLAYALVIGFHLATAALFPIGVFPWLMIGATSIFFAPGWCDRVLALVRRHLPTTREPTTSAPLLPRTVVFTVLAGLALVPVRGYLSDVGWSEHGGRFAWRVMSTNKVGVAELVVVPADGGAPLVVQPARDLSPLQAEQVTWQPDLLLQWAHVVAGIERERLGVDVEVYADVWVSINGSRPLQLVDPTVDLAQEEWSFGRPDWVLTDPR